MGDAQRRRESASPKGRGPSALTLRTWAQLSKRAAEYKIELLISTLISGEYNAEQAAQSAEQLSTSSCGMPAWAKRGG